MTLNTVVKSLKDCMDYEIKLGNRKVRFIYPDHGMKVLRLALEEDPPIDVELNKPSRAITDDLVDENGNMMIF